MSKKTITPIRTYTDNNGTWFIEFKKKEVKKLIKKFKREKK